MNRTGILLAVASLFAIGCPDGTIGGDTNDTDALPFYTGEKFIDTVEWSCDAGAWNYHFVTAGFAEGGIQLEIFETGDTTSAEPWEELHVTGAGDNTDWDDEVEPQPAEIDEIDAAYEAAGGDFESDDLQGEWDIWDLGLTDVATPDEVVSGQTTLWDCAFNDGGSLAYRATMLDEEGGGDDCVIWGYQATEHFGLGSCTCLGEGC